MWIIIIVMAGIIGVLFAAYTKEKKERRYNQELYWGVFKLNLELHRRVHALRQRQKENSDKPWL